MKKNNKKNRDKFLKGITKAITERGVEKTENNRYTLQTKLGILELSIHEPVYGYSVFGMFEDVANATDYFGEHLINKYSGKWNHHYTDGDELVNTFKNILEELEARG